MKIENLDDMHMLRSERGLINEILNLMNCTTSIFEYVYCSASFKFTSNAFMLHVVHLGWPNKLNFVI